MKLTLVPLLIPLSQPFPSSTATKAPANKVQLRSFSHRSSGDDPGDAKTMNWHAEAGLLGFVSTGERQASRASDGYSRLIGKPMVEADGE
ncbi:hypothetical protein E3N88_28202 [Mikania micrantha]|uniref:Uncharacterized protein n=1 Tax=Mikania micrantha TaxID=192012 RepID=A0A5N6MZE8_9ASTR|nr:hypothetical protein E3N88_28202 [Mikania micrantha]